MPYEVKNIGLADKGREQIRWAENHMPVLMRLRRIFEEEKPFKGLVVSAVLHVTKETAVLMKTLKAGGAEVWLAGSNPMSTQDDVAAALASEGVNVFAWRGESAEEYYSCIKKVAEAHPHIVLDDGADLHAFLHGKAPQIGESVWGGTEETTTGVIRLRSLEREDTLKYPVIAVNDSMTKYMFDNRYGTGQSTIDGILRATNILIAGKTVVVAGYGWVGKGIAMRARGMGAKVIVTEVNPIRALEALMNGYQVMKMEDATRLGDVFITATGNKNVIDLHHIRNMKDGAILANSGHFNVEINVEGLEKEAVDRKKIRENVVEYTLPSGRRIYLLAEGRLVNLVAAEGHPSEVMDMSFANQALAVKYISEKHDTLAKKVYVLPKEIDEEIALHKLQAMGVEIDQLTEEQRKYLTSWLYGT